MIKMTDIKKIVKLILISGYLKNHKPLSLLVVGKVGSGKTETITQHKSKKIAIVTDLSYMGALNMLRKHPKLKHFIIPDFLKITMKKRTTSDNLISLFNAMLEDGVGNIQMHNFSENFKQRVCGIIIATTKASYSQKEKGWSSIGFLSRMIICSYDYSDKTIEEILDYINSEDWNKEHSLERMTGYKDVIVTTEKKYNKQLNKFVNKKFRTLKQLQTLLKCNAIIEGRKEVNQSDVEEIIRLSKYLNLKYTKI